MTRVRKMMVGIGLLLAIPAVAAVINVNIAGDWTLTVLEPTLECTWVGPLTLAQTDDMFMGSATLTLQPGSGNSCPANLVGTVSGTISGLTIKFGVAMSVETAKFEGTIDPDQLSASGTWTVPGEFDGTWLAQRVVGVRAPALNAAGLAVLLVLLLAGGVYVLRRRAA
ncbi:MAG TPA: hypothetical protein VMW56_07050 [Candidatus Margulisiibacteriota bacterium]|nr:hypothetical protein [Candidatus Margulisiibacteriota bacterium]